MNPYCQLAKEAVKNYLEKGKIISLPENLPENFYNQKSGVFVTIKKENELRGCIGTYLATKENIGQEIISNAIAAATEDYRFFPINKEELDQLCFSVYLIGQPEQIESITELNPKIYGLLIKTKETNPMDVFFNGVIPYKTGLLLPGIEGIEKPEEQFLIACQKAGIDPEKEKVQPFRFKVEKYE